MISVQKVFCRQELNGENETQDEEENEVEKEEVEGAESESVVSSYFSSINLKDKKRTSVRTVIGKVRGVSTASSRRSSLSEYEDCNNEGQIEVENEARNEVGNEVENISECSDESYVSAIEEGPGTLNSRPGTLDSGHENINSVNKIENINSVNEIENTDFQENDNLDNLEEEMMKIEDFNQIIQQTEVYRAQILSAIRLLRNEKKIK